MNMAHGSTPRVSCVPVGDHQEQIFKAHAFQQPVIVAQRVREKQVAQEQYFYGTSRVADPKSVLIFSSAIGGPAARASNDPMSTHK